MSNNLDLLKQLRDITGAGILDCKKYLNRAKNNLDDAVKLMRSEEGVKADKKSSRIAAEGIISFYSVNNKSLLIEINSETDFVARSKDFLSFVNEISSLIIGSPYSNLNELLESKDDGLSKNIEEIRKKSITKLGEKICIRRYILKDQLNNHVVGYTHNNKIGAMVILKNNDEQLGKDICMQIVASNPLGLNEQSLDKDILASEKEIYKAELILPE